jgi:hypothetical protein
MRWEPWQRELHLPDRERGSAGLTSLEFACFRCGTTIVTGDQIFRLGDPDSDKNKPAGTKGLLNSFFTNCLPDTLIIAGKPFWNDSKNCNVNEVFCKVCLERGSADPERPGNNIGSQYDNSKLPDDCEPDTLGLDSLEQYCKLGHYRTHKNDGKRLQQLVAVGTEAGVKAALAAVSQVPVRSSVEAQQRDEIAQLKAQLARAERAVQLGAAQPEPEPEPRAQGSPGFRGSCYNCGKDGHSARDCDQPKAKFRGPSRQASAGMRAFDKAMKDNAAEIRTKAQAELLFAAMDECEHRHLLTCNQHPFTNHVLAVVMQMMIKRSCCSVSSTAHSTA